MPDPVAIDPPYCGCTECHAGEYVPLDQATEAQIRLLAKGKLANNTGTGRLVKRTFIQDSWSGQVYAEWKREIPS